MAEDESPEYSPLEIVREIVIYAIYGYTAYRFLDDLSDGALSLYFQNKWYRLKSKWQQEIAIRKQIGPVIFEAMETLENEK